MTTTKQKKKQNKQPKNGKRKATTMLSLNYDHEIESNMGFLDYYRKDTFGNVRYYIKQKRTAQLIKSLIGKETVSKNDMMNMEEAFNVNFKQVLPPEEEV